MNMKLLHPLWTHVPAVAALLAAIIFTVLALPLPDPAPLHFTMNGQPDRYGSLWLSTAWQAGIAVLYIILSLILDEMWARQEKRKTFNWLSLFDDITVAALAAVQITYVNMLASGNFIYEFPWVITIIAVVLAAIAAIIVEQIRPYRSYEKGLQIEDMSKVKAEIDRVVKSGQPLLYWEVQDPAYSRVLSVVVPLIMIVVTFSAWSEVPWLSVIFALIGIAMVSFYGGFRTLVTRQAVVVKMGIFGIRLLNLKTIDIISADLHNFSPLKDFGGYGIRFNKEMKAYFLRGDRGVKIKTRSNKAYLIGSDHPERLASIISTVCCNL